MTIVAAKGGLHMPALTTEPALTALAPIAPRRSAAEAAYHALREAVISLVLPPGAVVARAAIATRLGISQTPVREALIRLQEERLIEVVPQSATRVAPIDLASAREAQFLRLSVELEILRRLAQAPNPALAVTLKAEVARMEAARAAGDEAGFVAADDAFHAALYAEAGVPRLRELVRSRSGHLDRLRRLHLPTPGKADTILHEHAALAEAILAGDAAAAERHLRAHLSGTFAEVERLRAEAPQFF
jgi:DNA-binding GntR family transcriptional regulator